jgi:hypothetical protein
MESVVDEENKRLENELESVERENQESQEKLRRKETSRKWRNT